ncbi:MAG: hypothetical protein HY907_21030 [Deltaproteobacteria bacterium]|nr:hypothetical protein [Deltaproteobacteria bacterium]
MSRKALLLRRLAVVAAALGLGGCVGGPDGLDPPYRAAALIEAGVPSTCSVEDLAVVASLAAIADDATRVVALYAGEPLCLAPRAAVGGDGTIDPGLLGGAFEGAGQDPTVVFPEVGFDPESGWGGFSDARYLKSDMPPQNGDPPRPIAVGTPGGIVQDPTPQPARPGEKSPLIGPPPSSPNSPPDN